MRHPFIVSRKAVVQGRRNVKNIGGDMPICAGKICWGPNPSLPLVGIGLIYLPKIGGDQSGVPATLII